MEKPNYHLLIVDDEQQYRATIILALSKYFKVIDQAGNLEGALQLLQYRDYKIVITDGVFPKEGNDKITTPTKDDVNGILVARRAKKKGIYVIGISSEPKLLENVPDATLKKPFSLTDLQDIVKKHLGITGK